MAKKSFMGNPALQFITSQTSDEESQKNPITTTTPAPASSRAPAGYKPDPRYVEVKSRRLQLVMQPSLYAKVKSAADASGKSVNDYIHNILENATEGE